MPIPALIGAGGSILGGAISAFGQSKANQKNIALAREQMRFQERMSSTAYQRAAKDLEAAGLNRILALGNSASSPGGAMAVTENIGRDLGEGVSKAAHSAADLKMKQAAVANTLAQTRVANEKSITEQDQQHNLRSLNHFIHAQTKDMLTNTALKQTQIPMMIAEQKLWENLDQYGDWAKALQLIRSLMK